MRIIDNRKDYYDGVAPDSKDPIWVRESSVIKLDESPLQHGRKTIISNFMRRAPRPTRKMKLKRGIYGLEKEYTFYVIGFCGKFYVLYTWLNTPPNMEFFISARTPKEFVDKYNYVDRSDEYEMVLENDKKMGGWSIFGSCSFNDSQHYRFVDEYLNDNIAEDICLELDTPVFLLYKRNRDRDIYVEKNPILKDIGFQSIVDPWQTYQEIDRYIGNVLVNREIDDFVMTDELKRDSKGMDKWSFKQIGPKKRKRK